MPITGVCPNCRSRFPLEAAVQDAEARRALAAALGLPDPVARRVVPYLSLHAPRNKSMAWSKTARLLQELVTLISRAEVKRGHNPARTVTIAQWAIALDECLNAHDEGRLELPLDGHAWITGAVYRIAGRNERSANAARRGETPIGYHASHQDAKPRKPASSHKPIRRTKAASTELKSVAELLGHAPKSDSED